MNGIEMTGENDLEQGTVFLSVVIPAYNEEKRIGGTLEAVIRYLRGQSYSSEIVVVDDGSRDGTRQVAGSFQNPDVNVRLEGYGRNSGKGFAVKTGMLASRGQYAVFMDADLSTPIEMLERFQPLIEAGKDVIIGTRKVDSARIVKHQPKYRENMGKVFTWLSNAIFGLKISDFTCGFKCFSRRSIGPVFGSQRISGWSYDTEIIVIADRQGFAVQEVPVEWANDEATRVRLLKNVFTCFSELFAIWLNDRRGLYSR